MMKRQIEHKNYTPIVFREDITAPRFNTFFQNDALDLSDRSSKSDYFDEDEQNKHNQKFENQQITKKRNAFLFKQNLGITLQQYQLLLEQEGLKYKKLKEQEQQKQQEQISYLEVIDFENKSSQTPQKKKKTYKKFDDDEIHSFQDDKLKEYLEYKFIDEFKNKKQGELRKIIIMFKHPHLQINALKVQEFYIPVYIGKITDKIDSQQEFEIWRDFALKFMMLRGDSGDYVHLSNGIRVFNFSQIPSNLSILIFGQSPRLTFWQDFQKYYGFQLTFEQQRDFIYDLNQCLTKEKVYSTLVSLNKIQNKLLKREKDRMIKRESIKFLKEEKRKLLPIIRRNSMGQSSSQPNLYNKNHKFKKLQLNNFAPQEPLHQSKTATHLQRDKIIKQVENQIMESPNIFRKQRQKLQNRIKPSSTLQPTTYKPKVLKKMNLTFSRLPSLQSRIRHGGPYTSKTSKNNGTKQLVDLYSHYTGVLRTHVMQGEGIQRSRNPINFGSVMKSFNCVRMKIMQQSLPMVAKSRLNDIHMKNSMNKRYSQENTEEHQSSMQGNNRSTINLNEMLVQQLNSK